MVVDTTKVPRCGNPMPDNSIGAEPTGAVVGCSGSFPPEFPLEGDKLPVWQIRDPEDILARAKEIPAVVQVDGTAIRQTVSRTASPSHFRLAEEFE